MNPKLLEQHARAAQAIKAMLASEQDEELTLDMIEGETDFLSLLDRIMDGVADDESMIEAIKIREAELKARKQRIEARISRARQIVEQGMLQADLTKIERPEYTLSIRKGTPQLNVYDESAIPADYFKLPPPVLDKPALKAALNDGYPVPGASLNNGQPSLSVRRK
jgi:hypothetical protein